MVRQRSIHQNGASQRFKGPEVMEMQPHATTRFQMKPTLPFAVGSPSSVHRSHSDNAKLCQRKNCRRCSEKDLALVRRLRTLEDA